MLISDLASGKVVLDSKCGLSLLFIYCYIMLLI